MKQKLQELVDAVDEASTHFGHAKTVADVVSRPAPADTKKLFASVGSGLAISDLNTHMKHLDQFLGKKIDFNKDEKTNIVEMNTNLKENLDDYAQALQDQADNSVGVLGSGKAINIENTINEALDKAVGAAKHITKIYSK